MGSADLGPGMVSCLLKGILAGAPEAVLARLGFDLVIFLSGGLMSRSIRIGYVQIVVLLPCLLLLLLVLLPALPVPLPPQLHYYHYFYYYHYYYYYYYYHNRPSILPLNIMTTKNMDTTNVPLK